MKLKTDFLEWFNIRYNGRDPRRNLFQHIIVYLYQQTEGDKDRVKDFYKFFGGEDEYFEMYSWAWRKNK